jgi:hypothetical protein
MAAGITTLDFKYRHIIGPDTVTYSDHSFTARVTISPAETRKKQAPAFVLSVIIIQPQYIALVHSKPFSLHGVHYDKTYGLCLDDALPRPLASGVELVTAGKPLFDRKEVIAFLADTKCCYPLYEYQWSICKVGLDAELKEKDEISIFAMSLKLQSAIKSSLPELGQIPQSIMSFPDMDIMPGPDKNMIVFRSTKGRLAPVVLPQSIDEWETARSMYALEQVDKIPGFT